MSMDENDKKHFHRFVNYLLERFDDDTDRSDFESMVLVLHHFFQKEHQGITLDLSINQLLCYNGFTIDIPHFGESASLKTLSWIQRRFFEDIFGLLVFSFGADVRAVRVEQFCIFVQSAPLPFVLVCSIEKSDGPLRSFFSQGRALSHCFLQV